jgi:aldehyde:ferredoxin oxidoreductase
MKTDPLAFRIARIDLSDRTVREEIRPRSDFDLYLGGRGLNAKMLFEGQSAGADPFGPDNLIIFGTGKLVGTPVPTAGQLTITSKSPATGLYFKTNTGGAWARGLRRAGWDAVVVSGLSDAPVYIAIDDDKIRILDASSVWGKTVRETSASILAELGGHGWDLAAIGPAGENLVRFACVMTSLYHAAGRGGLGAVMGAKKLKAIAVRGSGTTRVVDQSALMSEIHAVLGKIEKSVKAMLYVNYGTAATIEMANEGYSLPVQNFRRNRLEGGHRLGGTYLAEKGYMTNGAACSACPLACHKYHQVKEGPYKGHSGGPEYETLAALGIGCCVTDTEAVLRGNELCNDLGLDTISAGGAIQWLLESVEKGVVSPEIGDDLNLKWGDAATMVALIERIAFRRGVGDLLAEGTKWLSEKFGGESWKWAVQAQGLEQSRVDTRVAKAYALAFAVNPRGPDHLHAQPMTEFARFPEALVLFRKLLGKEDLPHATSIEGKPELVRWHEDVFAVTDSLGICSFATTSSYIVSVESLCRMIQGALGVSLTESELRTIGRRTVVLERMFNLRENPNREDTLPWRLMNEPISEGPHEGQMNSESELKAMLEKYYRLQGYDPRTGRPTAAVLAELGLSQDVKGLEEVLRALE